jgi:phosphate acetyltransferase
MTVNDWAASTLHRRAREAPRHIVLPDGTEPRAIEAAGRVARGGLARVTLLGEPGLIRAAARRQGVDLEAVAIRAAGGNGREADDLVRAYRERRAARGLTEDEAREHLKDPLLGAALQVSCGRYDGLVAGADGLTPHALRRLLRGIGVAAGARRASSFTRLTTPSGEGEPSRRLIFADCSLNPDPTAVDLAEIALLTAESARTLLDEPPRIALLSFSTRGSADHPRTRKVAEATRIVRARAPDLIIDGELQGDAALVPEVAARKAPTSPIGGRANVLVFPDLESADIACRMMQALAGARTLGPILQGLARPANVMGPGDSADDLVDLIAVTAVQATEASTP